MMLLLLGRSVALAACASLALAASSQAATQTIGETQTGSDGSLIGNLSSTVQNSVAAGTQTYTVPSDGAITEWRHVTRSEEQGATMRLKVFRRTADPNVFFIVGESPYQALSYPLPIPNSFPISPAIQVRAGDVIGLAAIGTLGPTPRPAIWFNGVPGDTERATNGEAPPGSNQTFAAPGVEPARVNIAALFDPAETISAAQATPRKFAVDKKGPSETPLAASSVARGTTFRFNLTDFATVTYSIERVFRGQLKNGTCVKKKRPKKPRCTGLVRVGAFAAPAGPGANSRPFSGKLGKKALRPGSYRATLTAQDAAGSISEPVTLSFKVVKPRRRR